MEANSEYSPEPIHLIKDIEPIEQGIVDFQNRSEIKEHVESPLVSACEHFWDLNIKTLMSSANRNDIGNIYAYIDLDYNSLSKENKMIASQFGDIFNMHGPKKTDAVKINILEITPKTTSEQVEEKSKEIASLFKKQKALWVESFTIQEMREKIAMSDPDDESITIDWFSDYYYDTISKKFFNSEELFKKTIEQSE